MTSCFSPLESSPPDFSGVGNIEDPYENTLELESAINTMIWLPRTMVDVFKCLVSLVKDLENQSATIDLTPLLANSEFAADTATSSFLVEGSITKSDALFVLSQDSGESFEMIASTSFDAENNMFSGDVTINRVMGDGDDRRTQRLRSIYTETDTSFYTTISRITLSDNRELDEGDEVEYTLSTLEGVELVYNSYFGEGGQRIAGTSASIELDKSGCTRRFAGTKNDDREQLIADTEQDCWNANGEWID